jgi:hypothetical protein
VKDSNVFAGAVPMEKGMTLLSGLPLHVFKQQSYLKKIFLINAMIAEQKLSGKIVASTILKIYTKPFIPPRDQTCQNFTVVK